jgi:hypothetical protein
MTVKDLKEGDEIKAYITKYALTEGTFVISARYHGYSTEMIENITDEKFSCEYYHSEGKEWHLTEEGAKNRFEQMRTNKLKSLQAQITRLQGLKFNVVDNCKII